MSGYQHLYHVNNRDDSLNCRGKNTFLPFHHSPFGSFCIKSTCQLLPETRTGARPASTASAIICLFVHLRTELAARSSIPPCGLNHASSYLLEAARIKSTRRPVYFQSRHVCTFQVQKHSQVKWFLWERLRGRGVLFNPARSYC